MRTGNPVLNDQVFDVPFNAVNTTPQQVMTLQGVVNKSFILLALTMISAFMSWTPSFLQFLPAGMYVSAIAGFIVALIVSFKPTTAPYLAPVYALLEGVFIGFISLFFETRFPGIIMQAVGLTFGVFAALLLAYQTRIIKPTENFKLGIFAATAGIAIMYLLGFILSLFGIHTLSNVYSIENTSPLSIGISVVIVCIAALNLVLDFDFIENGVARRAPKYMEWYAAFGLLVTLVWLYIEILRLLAKLNERR